MHCVLRLLADPLLHGCIMQAFQLTQDGPLWFGLPVTQTQNSMLTLTVNADELTLVTDVANATITQSQARYTVSACFIMSL